MADQSNLLSTKTPVQRQPSGLGFPPAVSVSAPTGATTTEDAGLHLFHDVFRRADKNDDGRLSKEEFRAYFKDDLLTDEDLNQIFVEVDTDKTGTISLEELCNYFKKGYVRYAPLFAHLEQTHQAVSNTLNALAKEYSNEDFLTQFRSRFFLREFLTQTSSFQRPVEAAIDGLERQSLHQFNRSLPDEAPQAHHVHPVIHEPSITFDIASLRHQIERLSIVVNKLSETAPKLELTEEFTIEDDDQDRHFYVVSRTLHVKKEESAAFVKSLKQYLKAVKTQSGYFHVHVRRRPDINRYEVYEIFTDSASYEAHKSAAHSTAFAEVLSKHLEKPEQVSASNLPANWWPLEKNE